jgi:hypothetical protein
MNARFRLPVALAFTAAVATGALFHFTARHEGVGEQFVIRNSE